MKVFTDKNFNEFICPYQLPDGPCLGPKCVAFNLEPGLDYGFDVEKGIHLYPDDDGLTQIGDTTKDEPPAGGGWVRDGLPAHEAEVTRWRRDIKFIANCKVIDR